MVASGGSMGNKFRLFAIGSIVLIVAAAFIFFRRYGDGPTFERVAGLKLPRGSQVIHKSHDEYGPFGTEGFQCILVKVNVETIKNWLDLPVLNGKGQWKRGPVLEGVLRSPNTIPDEVLSSTRIHYAVYLNDKHSAGDVIVLDPQNEQAWLLSWY
jgi:hypothetical protein